MGGESIEENKVRLIETMSETASPIFQMAKDYEEAGAIDDAINLYKQLINEHAETEEAIFSRQALLRIAKDYVREGKGHMAISLYNEILTKY